MWLKKIKNNKKLAVGISLMILAAVLGGSTLAYVVYGDTGSHDWEKALEETEDALENLPDEVTLEDTEQLEKARDRVEEVLDKGAEKKDIDNLDQLLRAEDELSQLKELEAIAEETVALIEDLPGADEVTVDDESKIEEVRVTVEEALNQGVDEEDLNNLGQLEKAEDELSQLKELEAIAEETVVLIEDLPGAAEVTVDDESRIEEVRVAVEEALNQGVDEGNLNNLEKLKSAEEALAKAKEEQAASTPPDSGEEDEDEDEDEEVEIVRDRYPLLEGTSLETDLYVISADNPGPTVMVIGGVHGDEVAGYMAADEIKKWDIERGKLLVIPRANVDGIEAGDRRTAEDYDLNRHFPGDPSGHDAERIAHAIFSVMEDYDIDWVFDLHEAREFHRDNPEAVGQTLITYPDADNKGFVVSMYVIDDINTYIEESLHEFTLLDGPVGGSTVDAAGEYLGAYGMITETTRQLPLQERVFQQFMLVNMLLDEIDVRDKVDHTEKLDLAGDVT